MMTNPDPNQMDDWELAFALTAIADRLQADRRLKHRDRQAALIRLAARRIRDLAEQQGEESFLRQSDPPGVGRVDDLDDGHSIMGNF